MVHDLGSRALAPLKTRLTPRMHTLVLLHRLPSGGRIAAVPLVPSLLHVPLLCDPEVRITVLCALRDESTTLGLEAGASHGVIPGKPFATMICGLPLAAS